MSRCTPSKPSFRAEAKTVNEQGLWEGNFAVWSHSAVGLCGMHGYQCLVPSFLVPCKLCVAFAVLSPLLSRIYRKDISKYAASKSFAL